MDYLAGFALEAGAEPRLDVTPRIGFEACLLTGPTADVMVITNRAGSEADAEIRAPCRYTEVASLRAANPIAWDGRHIRCGLRGFETAVLTGMR